MKAGKPGDGARVYRVAWRGGEPYIQGGRVAVTAGPTGRTRRRVVISKDEAAAFGPDWSLTIKAAIARDVLDTACALGGLFVPRHNHRPKPWGLLAAMCRLRRLAAGLARHHLIEVK